MAQDPLPSSYLFSLLESQMRAMTATSMLLQSACTASLAGPAAAQDARPEGGYGVLDAASGRIRLAFTSGATLNCRITLSDTAGSEAVIGTIKARSIDELDRKLREFELSARPERRPSTSAQDASATLARARQMCDRARLRADFDTAVEALFAKIET